MLNATSIVFGSGDGTIQFNQSGAFTFSTPVSGAGSLVQRGTGTTTITGTHTYTGHPLVTAGTLIVNGTISNSSVIVNANCTLSGSGQLGQLSLESAAILSPGNSIGILSAGSLNWNAGAVLKYELGNGVSDRFNLVQALTRGGVGNFDFLFQDVGWVVGQTHTLITFSNTDFTVDRFSFINTGGFGGHFTLDGDSLDFTLTSIPEPSVPALCLLATTCFLFIRRRPCPF
jgi:autotransporter-associated beta strand protein